MFKMVDWSIKITKTINGYYVHPTGDNSDDRDFVVEIPNVKEEVKAEQLAFKQLAYALMDYFAVYNDKHARDGKGQYLTIRVDDEEE